MCTLALFLFYKKHREESLKFPFYAIWNVSPSCGEGKTSSCHGKGLILLPWLCDTFPLIPLLFLLSLSSSFFFFSSPLAFPHALCSCYSRPLSAPGPVKRPHTRASGKPGVFWFVSRRALPGTHYVYFLIVLEKSIWSRTGKSRTVHLGIPVRYQNLQHPT